MQKIHLEITAAIHLQVRETPPDPLEPGMIWRGENDTVHCSLVDAGAVVVDVGLLEAVPRGDDLPPRWREAMTTRARRALDDGGAEAALSVLDCAPWATLTVPQRRDLESQLDDVTARSVGGRWVLDLYRARLGARTERVDLQIL